MATHRYRDVVVGSVVDLAFTVRDLETRCLVDLEEADAEATCKIIDKNGSVIVAAGACIFLATKGRYRWVTAGMQPGTYRVRFTISDGIDPVPQIEPVQWAEITLIP
jgi:hypothetical protein